jgi:hypothetical protein
MVVGSIDYDHALMANLLIDTSYILKQQCLSVCLCVWAMLGRFF